MQVPSCAMSRHLDGSGMPLPMGEGLATRLYDGGVRRLLLGHTPHGNCPTVIKSAAGAAGSAASVDTFMADTSFSNMKDPSGDNRGCAVSELSLLCDGSTRVRGVLEDGQTAIDWQASGGPTRRNTGAPPSQLVGLTTPAR